MTEVETRLLSAARSGDVDGIVGALKDGANVDAVDHLGQTALILVATEGNARAVQILLDAGADLEQRTNYGPFGLTALEQAASWEQFEVATLLLKAGARPDAPSESGTTPLMIAAARGNPALVQLLRDPRA